nr:hypothetical protein Itr_chr12CG32110 [Ipomoea trifida]
MIAGGRRLRRRGPRGRDAEKQNEGGGQTTEDGEKGAYSTSCGLHNPGGSDAYRKTRGERGGDVHPDGAEPMRECDHIGDAADAGMLQ